MKKIIRAKVASKEMAAKEFVAAWHKLEEAEDNKESKTDERLYFQSAELLYSKH